MTGSRTNCTTTKNCTQNQIYQAAQQIDPKAESLAQKNRWFGTDNAMTYTAFDIHRRLVEEEGFDPQSDEYYSEVDKRIRLEFPHKFDTKIRNLQSRLRSRLLQVLNVRQIKDVETVKSHHHR